MKRFLELYNYFMSSNIYKPIPLCLDVLILLYIGCWSFFSQVAEVNGGAVPTPSFGTYYGLDQSHGMCFSNINKKHYALYSLSVCCLQNNCISFQFCLYSALQIILCHKAASKSCRSQKIKNKFQNRILSSF